MKKYTLLLYILLVFSSCEKHAKSVDVPEPVKTAFAKKYPNAQNVEWENEHDKYEAEFFFDGKKIEAEFSASGTFMEEEAAK